MKYNPKVFSYGLPLVTAVAVSAASLCAVCPVQAQQKKPNILVIMGDDVGWFNIGAYHRGIMSGKTPISSALTPRASSGVSVINSTN